MALRKKISESQVSNMTKTKGGRFHNDLELYSPPYTNHQWSNATVFIRSYDISL